MDKKLEIYLSGSTITTPPHMSSQKIQRILEVRKKRRLLIAMSFAALLWMMVFIMITALTYQLNPIAAYIAYGVLVIGLISSSIFSGLVLKFKKVGAEI